MKRHAFTLTELLVVIGIIVLLLAIGIPSLKAMFAGASVDSAYTQISSAVSAARAYADRGKIIRGNENLGYMGSAAVFVLNPNEEIEIHITQHRDFADFGVTNPPVQSLYAPVSNLQPMVLHAGVGVAGISRNGTTVLICPSKLPSASAPHGFAIRFNAQGQMLTHIADTTANTVWFNTASSGAVATNRAMDAVIGVIVFDGRRYADQFGAYPSGNIPSTDPKHQWIVTNGTTMLFSRYTGAVMRE